MQRRKAIMNSEKACYWLAAGILALGLSANYQAGGAHWACQLVNRSQALVASTSGQATRYLAVAQIMLGRGQAVAAEPVQFATMRQVQPAVPEFHAVRAIALNGAQRARMAMITSRVRQQLACARAKQDRLQIPNPNIQIDIPQIPQIGVADASVSDTR
jgi:hypothetical protein